MGKYLTLSMRRIIIHFVASLRSMALYSSIEAFSLVGPWMPSIKVIKVQPPACTGWPVCHDMKQGAVN